MEGVNRNTRQRGYEARDKEEMLKNCSSPYQHGDIKLKRKYETFSSLMI